MAHRGIACAEGTKFPRVSTAVAGSEHKFPKPQNNLDMGQQRSEGFR